LEVGRRHDLCPVNHHARLSWGRTVSEQFERRFSRPGEHHETEPTHLVTLCHTGCVTAVGDCVPDIGGFKRHLRSGLRGLSYYGCLEPAFYSGTTLGINVLARTFLSWHLHAIVWNTTDVANQERIRKLNQTGKFRPVADGLAGCDSRPIRVGELAPTLGYIMKPPASGYRVAKVADREGELVLVGYDQQDSALRPGERINLFHALKRLCLDRFAVAGGEGIELLANARRTVDRP
jgi:hypothetical protein